MTMTTRRSEMTQYSEKIRQEAADRVKWTGRPQVGASTIDGEPIGRALCATIEELHAKETHRANCEEQLQAAFEREARAIEELDAAKAEIAELVAGVREALQDCISFQSLEGALITLLTKYPEPKPDPLVEALNASLDRLGAFDLEEANNLRAELSKRGLEIRETEE
jgi:predicted RNase H-like nuclease (RuvC/YqgF family)